MRLGRFKDAIIKKLWFITLVTVFCTAITAYVNYKLIKPVYKSSLSMYVVTKSNASTNGTTGTSSALNYDDIMANKELIKDYEKLLVSNKVVSQTLVKLDIEDLSAAQLVNELTINLQSDSNLMEISINDNSSTRARDIVNTLGATLIKEVVSLTNQDNINIVDKAEASASPIKPTKAINIGVSFLISLVVSTGIVVWVEYLDDRAKSADDIEKKLGMRVIGIIPDINVK